MMLDIRTPNALPVCRGMIFGESILYPQSEFLLATQTMSRCLPEPVTKMP
jgi:hypothetical protein